MFFKNASNIPPKKVLIFCWVILGVSVGSFLFYRFGRESKNGERIFNSQYATSTVLNVGSVLNSKSLPHEIELLETPDSEGYNFFDKTYNLALQLPDGVEVKVSTTTKNLDLIDSQSSRIITLGGVPPTVSNFFRDACDALTFRDGYEPLPIDRTDCRQINNSFGAKRETGWYKKDCISLAGCEVGGLEESTKVTVDWTFVKNEYDSKPLHFRYSVEGDDYLDKEVWYDNILKTFKFIEDPEPKVDGEKILTYRGPNDGVSFKYKQKFPIFDSLSSLNVSNLIEGCDDFVSYIEPQEVCLYYPSIYKEESGFLGGGLSIVDFGDYPQPNQGSCYYFINLLDSNSIAKTLNGFPARYGSYSIKEEAYNVTSEQSNDIHIRLYGLYVGDHCYRIIESVVSGPVVKEKEEDQQQRLNEVWKELDEVLSTVKFID